MILKKKEIVLIMIILLLGVLVFSSILPKALAITTTKIYTSIKYSHHNLEYVSAEYAYGFGDYSVVYENEKGERLGFLVTPRFFPVIISHDPLGTLQN